MYESSKPRSRSEWVARFENWKKPASYTEEAKIATTIRRIRAAFDKDAVMQTHDFTIISQGSYHNNTNVKNDSDVDLCVCLNSAYFHTPAAGDGFDVYDYYEPLPFTFQEYKTHVASSLRNHFGYSAVKVGGKAISIHTEDDHKISADIVPAYTEVLYFRKSLWPTNYPTEYQRGIGFVTDQGQKIANYPVQHHSNGVAKNNRTSRRYKNVVRILKRLRNHMRDNNIDAAKTCSSFLIECLAYNASDESFANSNLYECVEHVLLELIVALRGRDGDTYTEVNEIKMLFSVAQPWSKQQALEFVEAAYAYIYNTPNA
ncbi:MAG: nucleotidyltransferase [Rickettsiales bacterium]|nr:nucleotidyltransferase [Rickettsiales bacterium]